MNNFVEAQMMIRKPVDMVFDAFIDPEKTKNFWFTKGSARLEQDKTVKWEWEMYNIATEVFVNKIIDKQLITIEWGEPKTTIDFKFTQMASGFTYVVITNYGFTQTGDELINVIRDSMGGFTTVLDGLKAYLEHNINLNLIADKFPREVSDHSK